jgi:hypothetical protein
MSGVGLARIGRACAGLLAFERICVVHATNLPAAASP